MPCTGDFQTFYKTLPCVDLFELGLAYHFFLALTFSHDLSFYGLKFGWARHLHVKKNGFFWLAFFKRKDDTPKHIKMDPFYTMNYVKIYLVLVRSC